MPDDVFLASPRKAPAHHRSTASLRPSTLAGSLDAGDEAANGRFSLAHELAVAMMPEPSAGSRLLAEEFGIEYDEGAEGIDEPPTIHVPQVRGNGHELSFADSDPHLDASFDDGPPPALDFGVDPSFGSPPRRSQTKQRPEQDAMEVLAQNLESTDNFLSHLRRLDADPSHASSSMSSASSSVQPALERLASDVIRRLNETARDREGQVRELLEYEREFRRIAGEVGGSDVLGMLEELPEHEANANVLSAAPALSSAPALSAVPDSPTSPSASPRASFARHARALSQEWETDPDEHRLGDTDPAYDHPEDELDDELHLRHASPTPLAQSLAFSPVASDKPPASTAAGAQLADLRGLTTSLVASLTSVSEHAQVNGAATAEAGRKIRALRNRLGGWRTEWEGAERSRGRIERWEAGEAWEGGDATPQGQGTPTRGGLAANGAKRVDGRAVVQEHLQAFELALAEAALKTKAIMAV
ncbi:hypothetical protein C8J57DRAFT_1493688 [Mycena rebaudengoi]|nr:hypothetical protein C8J57DRAFT_1493688 [Mycena rebaudengoi]